MGAALRAIRRWWLVFVIIVLVVTAGVGTYALVLPSEYEASGIVAFRPQDDKPVSAQVVLLTAPRYVAYATSPYVVQEVASTLSLDAEQLAEAIAVTMPATTANLEITVTWSDSSVAARAATALVEAVVKRVELDPILAGQLISSVSESGAPTGPPRIGITAVGLAGGILLGGLVVALLERRSRRLATWAIPVSREPELVVAGG